MAWLERENMSELLVAECIGEVGFITLNRPKALNALNLEMVRALTARLLQWQADPQVRAVAIRGTNKTGNFGSFCAGGDIRFFHAAALAGDPALEDFFTEEYALNYLIHNYAKPYIAFMDGVVMGGGMGISQGASHRLVTSHTKMAMPETNIGLFPDVGGGYFLSRCPGHTGEWLALTGNTVDGPTAVRLGLADAMIDSTQQDAAWSALAALDWHQPDALTGWLQTCSVSSESHDPLEFEQTLERVDHYFAAHSVTDIVQGLERSADAWAHATAATLRARSPLMLHVVLEQVRRARTLTLAEDLRMERDMVRHCFFTQHLQRFGVQSETVEGIRALAVDKDQQPRWNPTSIEMVSPSMVEPFFTSPWPVQAHPLAALK
jgi:enoyl-CoA hydratase/carnithine racemase